jgi:hypothetical protein
MFRKAGGLSERVKEKLLSGHWFDFLDGERVSDAELREAWAAYRDPLLESFEPESWCEDRPCWGEYVFDFLPKHGPRRGVTPDDAEGGFFVDERDAEPWRAYRDRIGRRRR